MRRRAPRALTLLFFYVLALLAGLAPAPGVRAAAPAVPPPATTLPAVPVRGAAASRSFAAVRLAPVAAGGSAGAGVGPNVDASGTLGPQSETSIAIDPQNPQVLVAGSNDMHTLAMAADYSSNGGASWTPYQMPLTDANGEAGAFASDPSVVAGANGTFYYSYILVDPSTGPSGSVVVSRSSDGGQTWSTPAVVAGGLTAGKLDDKAMLAVDNWATSPNKGNLYDVWTYNSDIQSSTQDAQTIEISMSSDGGLTWSAPVPVSPHTQTSVLYAQVQAAPDGSVYVVWDDYGSDFASSQQSVIRAAHCTVSGSTISCTHQFEVATTNVNLASEGPYKLTGACSGIDSQNPQPTDCYAIPPQPNRGIAAVPTLAVGPHGTAHVAWTGAPVPEAQSTYIDFSSLPAGATSWTNPIQISSPTGSSYDFLPWLTADPATGTLAATFYSTRGYPANQQAGVYLVQSTDGGATWSAPELVTSQPSDEGTGAPDAAELNVNNYGDYEGVAAYQGVAHAVWTDTRDVPEGYGEQVYTAAVTLSTAASVGLAATPGYAVAGGTAPTISGTVYDAAGNPVQGAAVDLSATAGSLAATQVTSGASGAYHTTLIPPAAAGGVTVTASVYGAPTPVGATAVVLVAPPGATVEASAGGSTGASLPAYGLSATAGGGTGALEIAEYAADPVAAPSFRAAGGYFDAVVSAGDSYTSLTLRQCNLSGTAAVYWWDAQSSDWVLASDQSDSGGCVTVTVGPGTSPSLADLGGTVFGAGTPLPALSAGDSLSFSPSPIAAAQTLKAGQTVDVAVYARDAGGQPLAGAAVYLSFTQGAGGGAASVGGTPLTAAPAEFQADGSGQLTVQYQAPATLPSGGTDTLTASSDATSAPAVQATDNYTFAVSGGGGGGGGGGVGGPPPPPPPPAVGSIAPASGPAAGGTAVTVRGSGFDGATAVDFGSVAATSFKILWGAKLTAVSPPGSGTVDVTVTNAAGTSAASPADRFTYTGAPPATPAPASPPPAVRFPDVPAGFWAAPYIRELVAKGIVSGFPNGTFGPDQPVTRAQFVKLLVLAAGLKPDPAATPFADVPPGAWFAPYVSAAVHAGLVAGVSPTSFGPNAVITREQMAVLVARAMAAAGSKAPAHATAARTPPDFSAVAAWARQGVQYVLGTGIMTGFPNGSFQPLGQTTRAQAAAVLVRMLKLLAGSRG